MKKILLAFVLLFTLLPAAPAHAAPVCEVTAFSPENVNRAPNNRISGSAETSCFGVQPDALEVILNRVWRIRIFGKPVVVRRVRKAVGMTIYPQHIYDTFIEATASYKCAHREAGEFEVQAYAVKVTAPNLPLGSDRAYGYEACKN